MPSDPEESRYRKAMVERLILGLTCRKYNLLYEERWEFSFCEISLSRFQAYAVNKTWYLDGYPWSAMKRKLKVITLSSPIGNIAQMHFWMAGIINMADYIKEERLDYPRVAIA